MDQTNATTKQVQKRGFEGVVVSIAGDKTLTVRVDTRKMHAKYRKQYTVSKKYAVHDEKNVAKVGDVVAFTECRPMSKRKRWNLQEVIKTAS